MRGGERERNETRKRTRDQIVRDLDFSKLERPEPGAVVLVSDLDRKM